jgi:outer membrane protein assembly factor BamB
MCRAKGFVSLVVLSIAAGVHADAGDWPQILGPERNGIAAADENLADHWTGNGPTEIWKIPVGRGFAGVAVVGETVLLFDRVEARERLQALNVADGTPRWAVTYPTSFVPQYGSDDGPMCVPTVVDGAVIVFGAEGVLSCFNLESGAALWQHDTQTEFDALEGYFGAGSSPVVEDGKVIVNVGGRSAKAGMVAFELATGKVIWASVEDGASYSSPVVANLNGQRRIIALTRLKCVVLDPADGRVHGEFAYGLRGPTVTAANPLVLHNQLFLSASYGIGARLVDLGGAELKTVWDSDDIMSSQYTTCVEHDGLLYGVDGRQDIPPATLRCFNPATQKVIWSEEGFGCATLIKADGKLVIMKTDGTLILAALGGGAYQELAASKAFNDTVRALPALSNGRLYVRDGRTLKCLDLRPQP